jgi:ligand-binding SRPBCC domain-containing protein
VRVAAEREFEFDVEAPTERVGALLCDPRRLDDLTPEWFSLVPLGELPGELGEGAEIAYRLRWRGTRWSWRSRILEWKPPFLFTYAQVEGPFGSFLHEHLLFEHDRGTRVVDRLVYEVPMGQWLDRLLVASELRRIFAYRAEAVRRELVPIQP